MFERQDLSCHSRVKALKIASCAVFASLVLLCAQVILLQAGLVRAQGTLDVCPGCTYESIQEAIDAADPADTIRVAQGMYTENLVITKSLTLLGGYESTGWTRDIKLYETTIDGSQSGSVISVTNGCSTTIDGFTVTDGHSQWGGGIYIEGSTATVANNRLWDNMAAPLSPDFGMDEPLLDGDTVVTGVGDASEPTWVSLHDKTSGAYIGSGQIQTDGRFTITVSSPLVGGHTILALGAKCEQDEAVVQAGVGLARSAGMGADGGIGEQEAGTEYPWAVEHRASLLETDGELEAPRQASGPADDQDGSSWLGGGIYLLDSTVRITGNEVVSNTALHFGGAIYAENSSVSVEANEILDNRSGATFPCSWDYGYGGGVAIVGCHDFEIRDNYIAENTILRGGGGVYITDSMGSLSGNEIAANASYYDSAWAYGGGVYVENCSPLIEGNDIISNSLGTESLPIYECAYGGGAYLVGSSSVVTDNDIVGNRVVVGSGSWDSPQGGGVFVADSRDPSQPCVHPRLPMGDVQPVIAGNRIKRNSATDLYFSPDGIGGGLSSWGTAITLLNNEIVSNMAGNHGAGVSVYEHCYPGHDEVPVAVEVSGNLVMSNTLSAEGLGNVGGLSLACVTGTVQNNSVIGNLGSWVGGLWVYGPWVLVEDNEVIGNEADAVGGVLAQGLGEVVLRDNLIAENTGRVLGGLAADSVSILVSHNEIMSNTGEYGGGIAVGGGAFLPTTVTLDANHIISNYATENGGGVQIWPDTVFTLTNNVIADNRAEEMGGGIYVTNSQGSLINNTIARNQEGAGEGIYLAGTADATILNNVIVSHTYGIYNGGSGTPDVTYNDVWGNSVDDYFGVTPVVGNISSDPRFVDPDNWDYHLWLHSPAVNAGNPDDSLAPPLDIDGDTRPLGSRVDMGADEVPFEVLVWKSDQPDPVLPGGLLTYTIRLSNVSEESYGSLVMTDRVPLNTSLLWASDDGEETEGVVNWSVGSLGVGEMVTRTMVVRVDEGLSDGMLLDNGEYGARSEELTRPVMGMPVRTRVGVPLLEISKVAEPDPVRAGSALTYTLELKNNGGIRATGLEISDMVPENTVLSCASDGGEQAWGVVTWWIPELGSGESLERTMVVTVAEGLEDGRLIENAEYGVQCDEVLAPVMGSLVTTTVGVPVLQVAKSDEPDPVLPGGELSYTIVVTNDGGWEAPGLVITERVPVGTAFYSASDGGELIGEEVSWAVPFLEAGGAVERTMVVTVSDGLADGSVIENDKYGVKSVDIGPAMGAPVLTLVGLPMLTIGKEVEPKLSFPGGELDYTITVNNEGHHVATGVVITDRVPVDASFAWALDGGELVEDEVRWTGLNVGPGESVTVRWGATVTYDLLVEEVVNESYGVLCSEVPEAVMGEALRTPLLRHEWWYPLAMKDGLR